MLETWSSPWQLILAFFIAHYIPCDTLSLWYPDAMGKGVGPSTESWAFSGFPNNLHADLACHSIMSSSYVAFLLLVFEVIPTHHPFKNSILKNMSFDQKQCKLHLGWRLDGGTHQPALSSVNEQGWVMISPRKQAVLWLSWSTRHQDVALKVTSQHLYLYLPLEWNEVISSASCSLNTARPAVPLGGRSSMTVAL